VHQHDVGVPAATELQGLPGPDGHYVDAALVLLLEIGEDESQQTGVGRAGGRSQTQQAGFRRGGHDVDRSQR
jgi:hypothetical protein